MGIKDLSKFLRGKCPEVYKEIHLSQFQFQKGAVDISLYIFKYYTIFGPDAWVPAFFNLVACLRRNNIHACFIYDTKAPEEKAEERQARREKRDKLDARIEELISALEKAKMTNEFDPILLSLIKDDDSSKRKRLLRPGSEQTRKISLDDIEFEVERIKKQFVKINQSDFDLTKKVFELLGVPFFQAPGEAETTCADLCKQGQVDFVISEDTDVLAYGAPLLFAKINTSTDTCICVKYEDVLIALQFTSEEFLDFCIMCGTDYNKNIPKVGCETAFKLMKKHKSIEDIGKAGFDISILKHIRVRELFTQYERFTERIPYCKPADFNALAEFMFVNNIRYNMEKLKRDLAQPDLFFQEE
jgi:5'-3' exonuclease